MNKRSICLFASAAMLAVALGGCASDSEGASSDGSTKTTSADTNEPIVVGLIDETSGPTAAVQKAAGEGAQLAAKEINDAGGINGRKLKIITRDTGGEAAKAIQGATELKQEGAVAIIGPVNGGICQAIAPTYAKLEIPGFCMSPVDLPKETDHMFGTGAELAQEDEIIFDFLGKENGKVGVLVQKTPVADLLQSHIDRFAGDLDVQVESVETTDTSAKAQMQALNDAGVGGILLAPCGPLSMTAAQEAVDLGYKGKIFVWNCFASDKAAKAFGAIGGDIYTVAPTFILGDAADDDPQKEAIDAYEAAGGKADIVEATGYDSMNILAGAIEKGGASSQEILDTLNAGYAYNGVWSAGEITEEDHRGAKTEGAMRLVQFTPEGTMEPVEGE